MPTATTTPTESTSSPNGSAGNPESEAGSSSREAPAPAQPRRRHAMDRAFPTRDFFRGNAMYSLLFSTLSAVLMGLLLATLLLTAAFLQTGGELTLHPEEVAVCNRLTEVEVAGASQSNVGLRAVVWQSRETFVAGLLAELYQSIDSLQRNLPALLTLLLTAVVLAIGYWSSLLWTKWFAARAGLDVATRLRRSLHRQALRVGPSDMQEFEHRHAMLLFTREADAVHAAVERRVFGMGFGIAHVAVLVAIAVLIDWRVALQCLIPLAACWYLFFHWTRRWLQRCQADEDARRQELNHLAEVFVKSRIIRGYGMDDFEHRQFQNDLEARRLAADRSTLRRQHNQLWIGWTMAGVATAVVLFFVGVKVLQPGGVSFASGAFLLVVFVLLHRPVRQLERLPREWSETASAADRIYRYLDRIPEVGQAVGAKFLQPMSSSLQFEAVRYESADRGPILNGVDLKLQAGKTYSFVSIDPLASRALAYLLPRFIEPTSGRVLIDGEDVAWVTLESLRAETAYVGGEAPWFSGTVLENIRCGDEHRSLQDVTEAAKTVHAHKFISNLPQGYETLLGEQTLRLNPGEAFRMALARAVLRQPAVMVIEEPAEALDADAKSLIDDAYNRILKGRTVIFLPSRLSTVRKTDAIVLIHDGKVEAIGKHAALVSSSAAYRHWEYTRFNQFRGENGNGLES